MIKAKTSVRWVPRVGVATLFLWLPSILTAQGHLVTRQLSSRALGVKKSLTVYLPAAYDTHTADYWRAHEGEGLAWLLEQLR